MKNLMERTCRIIEDGGYIMIKGEGDWYLSQYSVLQRGRDGLDWSKRESAMSFGNLEIAFDIAKTINKRASVKVVVYYPKGKRKRERL